MSWGRLGSRSRALLAGAAVVLALAPGQPASAAPTSPAAVAGQSVPDDGAQPGDPALSIDAAAVAASMTCRGPVDGGDREPVLLVHGTFVTAGENYGWNYLPELAARGYRVCTVELPNRSLDDIQVAAESVVVGVHRLARETGRKVDVLAHSQGVLEARWAVKWWPSVQGQVDDLVSLAGPNQGTTVAANPLTPLTGCAACLQMAPGSAFVTALNAGDQTPGKVSYTSIYSTLVDELITPNATAARIQGASNLELQAICPGRVVTHVSIVADAAAYALALDAFGRPGPATAARFDRSACLRTTFVGAPGLVGGLGVLLTFHTVPVLGAIPTAEPPLKPYARPAPTRSATSTAVRAPAPAPAAQSPAVSAASRPAGGASAAASATPGSAQLAAAAGAPAPATLPAEATALTRTSGAPGPVLPLVAALALVAAGAAGGITARRLRSASTR